MYRVWIVIKGRDQGSLDQKEVTEGRTIYDGGDWNNESYFRNLVGNLEKESVSFTLGSGLEQSKW